MRLRVENCIISLLLFVNYGIGAGFLPGKPKAEMNPDFALTLARTDLIVGESARFHLAFRNRTAQPISFPELGAARNWLRFKLVDAAGKEKSWSSDDLEDSHEFKPPPQDFAVDVPPGKATEIEANLSGVIRMPTAGNYSLTAEVKWPGGSATTPPVPLVFRPMSLTALDIQPFRSGRPTYQNILWAQAKDRGSVLILSTFQHRTAPNHEHPEVHAGLAHRVHESQFQLDPMIAVPPSRSQYPEHWFAWIKDGQLTAFMEEYGKTKIAPFTHPVAGGTMAIRPMLQDPGNGDCHLAFWEQAVPKSHFSVSTLRKDQSMVPGPKIGLASGRLAWSAAFYPETRTRIYLLAVEHQGQTSLEQVTWPKDGAALAHSPLARFPGAPLAASAFLLNDNGITGAVLAKARHETGAWDYFVYGYSISAQGAYTAKQPIRLAVAKGVEFGRAFIEVGLKGDVIALMEATDGRWYLHASDGAKRKLAADADLGTPLGLTWADDAHPRALFWSARKGFRFVEIVREG